jgi:hypothetical protein
VLLKPADGNAWRVRAVDEVQNALKEALGGLPAPQIIF